MSFDLDAQLPLVRQPSRYIGNEFNVVKKDWQDVDLRMVLAFPDMYEIGMSHQGLQMLYHLVNDQPHLLAERVYAPDKDLEALLRKEKQPLFALESHRSLADFDIIGITLPFELCYTNILTILDLGGIPLRASERDNDHPLVLGGGPCAFHAEPVAEFFDAILLGDGEEAIIEVADLVAAAKKEGISRSVMLGRLQKIKGIYIPSFFAPSYDEDGELTAIEPLHEEYPKVERRILSDLDAVRRDHPPLVPTTRIVHDRLGLEIARGCTRGCRFCQAGMIYRPVRERMPQRFFDLARKGIDEGGFDELALLSLSTGDYSCLSDLLIQLMDTFAKEKVSVSLPSLRVGTLTPEIMEQIKRVRKTGFTLAPEAGTDRLRRVINKGITEEDLLDTAEAAYGLGWKLIKLYFMFGLPTETEEDLEAIAHLAKKVMAAGKGGPNKVTVSAATFVPKPHTPFEREPQQSVDEGFASIDRLKQLLPGKKYKLKWHDPRQSYLEGVFARGDRKLSSLIEKAWQRGARFDAWSDHYDLGLWQEVAQELGLDLDGYLRRRKADEVLPWQHLDVGVEEGFLSEEYDKALQEEYTPDCRVHGCQKCGLCDFKELKPITHGKKKEQAEAAVTQASTPATEASAPLKKSGAEQQLPHFYYRLQYSRLGGARLFSHLELIQVFYRVFRRLELPLNYSQGFNPTPKVSFSPALPLGTESLAEYLVLDLNEPIKDIDTFMAKLNEQLVEGLTITSVTLGEKEKSAPVIVRYHIWLPELPSLDALAEVMGLEHYEISLIRKGKLRKLDLRPLIKELAVSEDGALKIALLSEPGKAGVKPMEAVSSLFQIPEEQIPLLRVLKLASEAATVHQ